MRTKLSKIFLVPLKVLEGSDEGRYVNITQKVYQASSRAAENGNSVSVMEDDTTEESSVHQLSEADVLRGGTAEYADAECACRHCLPVRGDTIIGTRGHTADAPTIVHRLECPYAQQALNDAKSGVIGDEIIGDPVKLRWSETESWDEEGNNSASQQESFLAEIVVMANDRKLLLADCSVIASKNSEILKTGSSSTAEHCTLEFLVRVSDLEELQTLMNKLGGVHSVMSVERRFGSELLE